VVASFREIDDSIPMPAIRKSASTFVDMDFGGRFAEKGV